MIFHKSNAIVIGGIKYSETSKIIKLFTEDFGKVSLIAKGARRKKSDFRGVVENFNFIEAVFIPGKKELHTLVECYLFDNFYLLKDNLQRLAVAYKSASLIDETQPIEDPSPEVFELLLQTLRQLNCQRNYFSLAIAFQFQLLYPSGFLSQFNLCAVCGRPLGKTAKAGPVFYHPAESRFVCGRKQCTPHEKLLEISPGSFEIMRTLSRTRIDRAHTLKLSRAQFTEIDSLLKRMFEYTLERRPRAVDLLDHVDVKTRN